DQLAAINGRAKTREAEELQEELVRLREQDVRAITAWVEGGAVGPRPKPREEMLAAERRYGEIARAATEARARLPEFQQSLTEAVQRLRAATTERDRAIFAASVEACESTLAELDNAIVHVWTIEARLC